VIKQMSGLKGFMIGFMCCALFSATAVYAADSSQIQVYFHDLKYRIDGVSKKPLVNRGFIYNGTAYVPLRFISEALGKEVSWDGDNDTIWIGKKEGSLIELSAMDYARIDGAAQHDYLVFDKWNGVAGDHPYGSGFTIAGFSYSHGLGIYIGEQSEGWGSIDYNIKGNYKRIMGTIGIDDYYRNSNAEGIVHIYGDGKEIYTSPNLKGGDVPLRIDVNTAGVLKLRIKFESNKKDDLDIVFAEAQLVQ
jgi:hypothetical protein